jgi:import inner membrane translocase subunit TIM10
MFGGFGRPQPSSAEKIAAAEAEMDLVTQMFNKYALFLPLQGCILDIR